MPTNLESEIEEGAGLLSEKVTLRPSKAQRSLLLLHWRNLAIVVLTATNLALIASIWLPYQDLAGSFPGLRANETSEIGEWMPEL